MTSELDTADKLIATASRTSGQALHTAGGLSTSIVLRRQEDEGLNELPTTKPRRLFHIVISILSEPMVYLLLGCGLIYFLIGDRQEALMLIGFLLLILGIEVFQEHKAERALEALRDLSSPRALVLREGIKQRIPGKEVVREDLIFLSEGDRVPADAIIIFGSHISADESLLTGESIPVDKDIDSSVFAGTTVVRGQGVALVTAIALNTELGKIGKSIQASTREHTKLEAQTTQLVRRLAWIAGAVCVLVFVIFGFTRGNWLGGALAGLTLAMAILPNELPAVLTIFLALGAWRISQRRVLTRKLPAVENLGAATILCVDKTGTLTLNQMKIQKLFSRGEFADLSELKVHALPETFHEALEFGILASRQDPFDPMELAFTAAGLKYLRGTEHLHHDWALEKEYPLSPELLAISHAWKPRLGGGFVIGAKGAPEAIIDLCHMGKDDAAATNLVAEQMAANGLRVLGVAKALTDTAPLPQKQHDFPFSFVGLIGLADPIRPEVPKAVAECRSAGIRVVMITGDHPVTACSIAKSIGLEHPDLVVTGSQLKNMSSAELATATKNVSVFSRVAPDQKLILVEAFKAQGEIVAMTGDGVNDAPALKSAHIGIAMGGRGTDVARESASLVLLDDDFGSIVEAIRMGRRVYANLKGAFAYLFAVHIPIAGMSILPVIFKMPLVLLPAHIALLHLIIEPTSSIAFEVEPADDLTMKRPPRNPNEPLFSRNMWLPSILQGSSILIALLGVYLISLYRNQGEADARTLVFSTLIVSNIVLIFASRGSRSSLLRNLKTKRNSIINAIAVGSVILLACALYFPSLRQTFHFSILHIPDIAICLAVGTLSVIWIDFLPARFLSFRRKPFSSQQSGAHNEPPKQPKLSSDHLDYRPL